MNMYSAGKNLFIDLGPAIYWLQMTADKMPKPGDNPLELSLATGTRVDSASTSYSGKPVIRFFEGDSQLFTITKSGDQQGFSDFVATRDLLIEKEGSNASCKGYSATHEIEASLVSVEVHVYSKGLARQFNSRPNLSGAVRDEFVDWCL